jgi:hypothetical protein
MVEEQILGKVFEYSLVGGAFIYLLFFVTKTINKSLTDNTEKNASIAESMIRISDTLTRLDLRMEKVEQRLLHLEGGDKIA